MIRLRRIRSTTRRPSRRCTTRAASSLTGACRRTSTRTPATNLGLPDPRELKSEGKIKKDEVIEIEGFRYYPGGYSAVEDFPTVPMRPPVVKAGRDINFTNNEALFGEPDNQQVWHSHHVVQGAL